MLAVLLAAVLTAGMVSNAVQASVLAQEESGTGSVSANDAEPTEEENGNLQALLERIAALPDVGGQRWMRRTAARTLMRNGWRDCMPMGRKPLPCRRR